MWLNTYAIKTLITTAALVIRCQNGHYGLSTQQSPLILVDHTASSNQVLNNFLFLSNSIFLSRIWVCIKGSWNWTILLKCLKINHKVIFKCCMKYLDRKLSNCQNSHLFFKQTVYNWIVSIALFRHHLLKLCLRRQNFTMKWVNTSAHVERLVTSDMYF